jgi:hypothetical protein
LHRLAIPERDNHRRFTSLRSGRVKTFLQGLRRSCRSIVYLVNCRVVRSFSCLGPLLDVSGVQLRLHPRSGEDLRSTGNAVSPRIDYEVEMRK